MRRVIPLIDTVHPTNPDKMPIVQLDEAHSPFKLLAHADLLAKFVEDKEFNPVHMRLGITGGCNMRCNFCNFHSSNEQSFYDLFSYKDYIPTAKCIALLADFANSGGRAVTLCGSGENTTHPGFTEICHRAHTAGLRVGLITNGSRLHHPQIAACVAKTHTWVRIGMNAGTEATFDRITHSPDGTYDRILSSIRVLRADAMDPEFRIGLNFVITLENFREIREAAKRAHASGAHYIRFEPEFYSAQGHEMLRDVMDEVGDALIDVAREEDERFEVSVPKLDRGPMDQTDEIEGNFNRCHYSRFVTAVGADGNLYPCPQVHLNSRYRIGNVLERGYEGVLMGGPRAEWEAQNPLRTELCKTCFYRPQNELLQKIKDGQLEIGTLTDNYRVEVPKTLHADFV